MADLPSTRDCAIAATLIVGFVFYGVFNLAPASPEARTGESKLVDSCTSTEQQVRDMWVATFRYPESERVGIAADAIQAAERLCREWRDAKPTPLPPELQKLAR